MGKQTIAFKTSFLFTTSCAVDWKRSVKGSGEFNGDSKDAKFTRDFIDGRKWSLKIHKQHSRDWYLAKPFFRLKNLCFPSAKHNIWNRRIDKAKYRKRPHAKHAQQRFIVQQKDHQRSHLFRLKLISIKHREKSFFFTVLTSHDNWSERHNNDRRDGLRGIKSSWFSDCVHRYFVSAINCFALISVSRLISYFHWSELDIFMRFQLELKSIFKTYRIWNNTGWTWRIHTWVTTGNCWRNNDKAHNGQQSLTFHNPNAISIWTHFHRLLSLWKFFCFLGVEHRGVWKWAFVLWSRGVSKLIIPKGSSSTSQDFDGGFSGKTTNFIDHPLTGKNLNTHVLMFTKHSQASLICFVTFEIFVYFENKDIWDVKQ